MFLQSLNFPRVSHRERWFSVSFPPLIGPNCLASLGPLSAFPGHVHFAVVGLPPLQSHVNTLRTTARPPPEGLDVHIR